jgi:hypothetical protein
VLVAEIIDEVLVAEIITAAAAASATATRRGIPIAKATLRLLNF